MKLSSIFFYLGLLLFFLNLLSFPLLISEQKDSLLFYAHLRKKKVHIARKKTNTYSTFIQVIKAMSRSLLESLQICISANFLKIRKNMKSDTFWVLESGVTRCSGICSAIEITSGKTASLPSFSSELFKSFKKITFIECEWLPLVFTFLFIDRSLT